MLITTYSEQIPIDEPPLIYSVNRQYKKDPYNPDAECAFADLIIETKEKKYTFTHMRDPEGLYLACDEFRRNSDNSEIFIGQYDEHCYDDLIVEEKFIFPTYGNAAFTKEQILGCNITELACCKNPPSIQPAPAMWHILESSSIGRCHNTPYQDWSDYRQGAAYITLAVAGGNGFCRSQLGSRFACEAACEVLSQATNFENVHYLIKERFDSKVNDDLAANPLNENERRLLNKMPPQYAYDTTLICAHITAEGVYSLRHGNGEIHILDRFGTFLPSFFDYHPCSMVDKNACMNMCCDFTPTEPGAVILFSDGYESRTRLPWDLLEVLNCHRGLPENIPEDILSNGDNGDDQTIIMAVNKFHACMQYFQKGLAEERKKLLFQEINELL